MPRVRHPRFHNLVSRHQPAWANGTKMRLNGFRVRRRTPPFRDLVIPAPQFVIPAKAGIQRGGAGCGNDARTLPPTNAPDFHTFACRHQPACPIAMKACPGPRSGIDRCGSLSFAIRGIPSSIRPPIRHSGEGRNPEGKGGTNHTQTLPMTRSHFHTLVCRRPPAWAIGTKIVIRCHRIRHSGEGRNPEGKGGTNHAQTLPTTRPHFHTLVCRRPPACAIAMKIVIRCHRIRHSRGSGNPEGRGGTNHTQTLPTTRPHFHTLVCRRQPA